MNEKAASVRNLEQELSRATEARQRLSLYYNLNEKIRRNDPQRAIELARQSLKLATEIQEDVWIAKSLVQLGHCYIILGNFDTALAKFTGALRIYRSLPDKKGQSDALHCIGIVYKSTGEYEKALERYTESLALREQLKDQRGIALLEMSIGNIHAKTAWYEEALKHYLRSLKVQEEVADIYGATLTLHNIGNVYGHLRQNRKALDYYHMSLQKGRDNKDSQRESRTYGNIASIYQRLGDYNAALTYANQAMESAREIGDRHNIASIIAILAEIHYAKENSTYSLELYEEACAIAEAIGDKSTLCGILRAMGDILRESGRPDEALEKLRSALELSRSLQERFEESSVLHSMALSYEAIGDIEEAYACHKQFSEMREEIHSTEMRESLAKMQSRFDVEHARKEKEIYRLKNVELAGALAKLEELNKHLLELDAEKSDLLGIVAHDLKNPLSNIMMNAKYIKRLNPNSAFEEAIDCADDIELASQNMFDLISTLLDISAIESGKMQIKPEGFNLFSLVRFTLGNYQKSFDNKSISVELPSPSADFMVIADRGATRQVLDNLVSNAVKFSPRGSTVHIGLLRRGNFVLCEVRDEGPGLSAEDLKKAFGKFARLSARPTGGEQSTGVGLWIVKKLVEKMHGRAWISSTLGEGSTFSIELPAASRSISEEQQSENADSHSDTDKTLLSDDHASQTEG